MSSNYDKLVNELLMHNLIEGLCRSRAEEEFVSNFELRNNDYSASNNDAISVLKDDFQLNSEEEISNWKISRNLTSENKFIDFAHYRNKRKLIIEQLMKGQGESLFLRFKDRLDRVLYSILRVENNDKAFDLYYAIEANELDFGEAASIHSLGPENKTQGIIGPVDLTTPHPDIASRLRTAKPRQLFPPFELNNQYAILRLDYRFDSEYNEKAKKFLGTLIFNSQYKSLISKKYKEFLDKSKK